MTKKGRKDWVIICKLQAREGQSRCLIRDSSSSLSILQYFLSLHIVESDVCLILRLSSYVQNILNQFISFSLFSKLNLKIWLAGVHLLFVVNPYYY